MATSSTTLGSSKRPRRMAREANHAQGLHVSSASLVSKAGPAQHAPSKLDQIEALLLADTGASIAEMVAVTGWQQHSVRGAMAGALKKRRQLTITSDKIDGVRRYRGGRSA